ncbi:MAG: signal peptidase I [Alphaproteobacteria bacterium]|nr:signal peptidase I [Alphaproteobacteria bacterium]
MWAALAALIIPIILFGIMAIVVEIVGAWFMFEKAGEPGWAAIIPIYNYLIGIKIAGKPWWYILLMLIPFVNLIIYIIILDGLAKSFGKSSGFTLGLFFFRFIFIPILGFGNSVYSGDKTKFGA